MKKILCYALLLSPLVSQLAHSQSTIGNSSISKQSSGSYNFVSDHGLVKKKLNWSKINIELLSMDIDSITSLDMDVVSLSASFAIGDNMFVSGSYDEKVSSVDFEKEINSNLDIANYSIGFGALYGLNRSTDLFGSVSYLRSDGELNSSKFDENGHEFEMGVRTLVGDRLDLSLSVIMDSFESGDYEKSFNLSVSYFIYKKLSIGVNYSRSDNGNTKGFNASYHF